MPRRASRNDSFSGPFWFLHTTCGAGHASCQRLSASTDEEEAADEIGADGLPCEDAGRPDLARCRREVSALDAPRCGQGGRSTAGACYDILNVSMEHVSRTCTNVIFTQIYMNTSSCAAASVARTVPPPGSHTRAPTRPPRRMSSETQSSSAAGATSSDRRPQRIFDERSLPNLLLS